MKKFFKLQLKTKAEPTLQALDFKDYQKSVRPTLKLTGASARGAKARLAEAMGCQASELGTDFSIQIKPRNVVEESR